MLGLAVANTWPPLVAGQVGTYSGGQLHPVASSPSGQLPLRALRAEDPVQQLRLGECIAAPKILGGRRPPCSDR